MFATGILYSLLLGTTVEEYYPLYKGDGVLTTLTEYDRKGRKVHVKCHTGKSSWWKYNVCKVNPKVNGRVGAPADSRPYCLAVSDKTKNDVFPEDVNWHRYKWVRCVAPQCAIRQV